MSDIASVADEPLTRAQIHMGEPEGEPLLDAVDLVAGYIPGVNILNGASLTLHEGEIVGIIGPNGAGKSTLLKSLFGLVHIHSGKLLLKGEDITNLRADKLVSRGVGFVPQTENVFPSLTIAENLHMGAFQAPKLFNERFDYVCSIFPKLGQRKNQLAGQLSGGERQMVAMARARRAEGRRHGRYDRAEEPYGRLRLHQGQGMRFLQGLPRPAEGRQGDSVQGPDLHRRVQRRA